MYAKTDFIYVHAHAVRVKFSQQLHWSGVSQVYEAKGGHLNRGWLLVSSSRCYHDAPNRER